MKKKLNCVLLIDDDEATNYLNQELVAETGCAAHIEVAPSGSKALEYLTRAEACSDDQKDFPCPELIFLDINMPAMNGWEFLERYRKLENKHKGNVIVVMLTTSLFPDDKRRAETIPEISGFENKPLTPETIERIVKKFFPDRV